MIGPAFTYQRLSKDFIFKFIKIWAPIFVRPKAVTDLKTPCILPEISYGEHNR